jgi:hypothetical protein
VNQSNINWLGSLGQQRVVFLVPHVLLGKS